MTLIKIACGPFSFDAKLEEERAPKTCAVFRDLLPYEERVIHVRWSGEGVWIPLGERNFGIPLENQTSYPAPGEFLFYNAAASESEIIMGYGAVCFASKVGQLAGNHFLTITSNLDKVYELGRKTLYDGAQPIRFSLG